MDRVFENCLCFVLGVLVCSLVVDGVGCTHYDGYRAGQIDAANGVMKYELVEQGDGATSWELKDE